MRSIPSRLRFGVLLAVLGLAACTPSAVMVEPGADEEFIPGDSVAFSGTAADPLGGAIATWHWAFGDEISETTETPTTAHTYEIAGTHTATLTVTTEDGRTSACPAGTPCSATVKVYPVPCTSSAGTACMSRLDVSGMKVRVWRSHPLDRACPEITRAVVVQHGNGRTADSYFGSIVQATATEGLLESTLIVAVQFITLEEGPRSDELYWTSWGWKQGDRSLNQPELSAFEVTDHLFAELAAPGRFPNLETIVLAGHSAGGQFVNRFASGSPAEEALTGVDVRYIVANPSSYLYLNEARRVAGSLDRFAVPEPGDIACPLLYNVYKYGLEGRNDYMSRLTEEEIRTQYTARDVVYLLGTDDDDPESEDLDTGCAAMAQGDHRWMRGTIFFNHLCAYFDCTAHSFVPVPGVGHSGRRMFTSPEGRAVIFE